ncbi:transcription factor SOX-2 [Elysia marginata]|uniref:Transcription factor SOX-2 n=1 Tax=Elysia marginata TaxID=1093978 RepID=A0AAV4HJT5_9GAST|nr:transcription factor SOX-2 [Elysia marginata]
MDDLLTELMMGGAVSYTSATELAEQNFSNLPIEALISSQPLDASPRSLEVNLDSPDSLEINVGTDMLSTAGSSRSSVSPLLADDNMNSSFSTAMSPSFVGDDQSDVSSVRIDYSPRASPALIQAAEPEDDEQQIEQDKLLIATRYESQQVFPTQNSWSLSEKLDRLLKLSPCKKFPKDLLMRLDEIEDACRKVDILIEFVCRIKQEFPWNHVQPQELNKAYTSVTNCKKEKRKDSEGHFIPKRPMNAFMIWSKQCRSFISQICPQLHNATISKKLGFWWSTFSVEERQVFEKEKKTLSEFHNVEFPDYKYRPRKKASKKADEKPETASKAKQSKKRKSPSSKQTTNSQPQQQQQHHVQTALKGINITEPRANLDPALQRKLQSKMNVKIDPGMRRDVSLSQGSRYTAINLTDLHSYTSSERSASPDPVAKRLCLRPIEVQQQSVPPTTIDLADPANASTVFDTPGNSPHTPVTPVTPNESPFGLISNASQGQQFFDFSGPAARVPVLMEQLASSSNKGNSIVVSTNGSQFVFPVSSIYKASAIQNNIIANSRTINENNNNNHIIINNNNALLQNNNVTVKTEPLLFRDNNVIVKSEPIVLHSHNMAVKSVPLLLHNDNLTLKPDSVMEQTNKTVKVEPVSPQWSLSVKTEADHFAPAVIKTEPEVTNTSFSMPLPSALDLDSIQQLPMLSADVVDEVLEAGITSYNDNLLTDIMTLFDGTTHYESLEGPATV